MSKIVVGKFSAEPLLRSRPNAWFLRMGSALPGNLTLQTREDCADAISIIEQIRKAIPPSSSVEQSEP